MVLEALSRNCRMVFFTGLPASGKSFLLRQQTLAAAKAGRRVHMLRWDAGLAPFQSESILARYPDVEDGSHPIIRKAAGLWGRQAVARWIAEFDDPKDLLIGEVPIIGNRFSELIQKQSDAVESALASDTTTFIYPVPSKAIRQRLEAIRRATFANPSHPEEAKDAPPATMDLAWKLTLTKSLELGLRQATEEQENADYDEKIYRRFFDHLLQHRNARVLEVGSLLLNVRSAHALDADISELIATEQEVANAILAVEQTMTAETAACEVAEWHRV